MFGGSVFSHFNGGIFSDVNSLLHKKVRLWVMWVGLGEGYFRMVMLVNRSGLGGFPAK